MKNVKKFDELLESLDGNKFIDMIFDYDEYLKLSRHRYRDDIEEIITFDVLNNIDSDKRIKISKIIDTFGEINVDDSEVFKKEIYEILDKIKNILDS
jgi:hypothetical protein